MIYDVKPGAKLQINPQISKSFHKLLSRNMLVPKSFHLALEPRMTSHGQTTSRQMEAKVRIFVEGEKEGFLY